MDSRSRNVGPWLRDRRLKACVELVNLAGYGLDRTMEKGVSPGFLAVVLESNLEEVLDRELGWAIECGELGCDECEEYFTREQARIEGDVPHCPECGRPLRSNVCALCGCDLHDGAGVWRGQHLDGFCFCPECVHVAEQELGLRAKEGMGVGKGP